MAIRDILLYVHPQATESSLIQDAARFARAQQAHLTGLYALEYPEMPGYVEAQIPRDIIEKNRAAFAEQSKHAESVFQDACTSANVQGEWRCVERERAEAIFVNGRLADLVIMAGGRGSEEDLTADVSGRTILECGRPVLLVPPNSLSDETGSRILLAWNGRREATRAAHDALPLMRQAEWVRVVIVNPGSAGGEPSEVPGSEICRHLARHDVKVEAEDVSVRGESEGATLLTWAKDENANMLVMGAYGRSRWRELVFGGVTAHVLEEATLPVFMSH